MAFVFLFLGFIFFGMLVVGLVKPEKVLSKKILAKPGNNRVKAFVSSAIWLVICIIGFVAFVPSSDPQTNSNETATVADSPEQAASKLKVALASTNADDYKDIKIEKILDGKDNYDVALTYYPKSIWSASSYIAMAAMKFFDAGKKAKQSGLSINSLIWKGQAPSVDKYGNQGVGDVIRLTIKKADLDKVNWEHINQIQLLNLADVTFYPMGTAAAGEFCAEKDNLKDYDAFCRKLILKH